MHAGFIFRSIASETGVARAILLSDIFFILNRILDHSPTNTSI